MSRAPSEGTTVTDLLRLGYSVERAEREATHVIIPRAQHETLMEALDNSQSLLVAILHEQRPEEEIEAQIIENRAALRTAGINPSEGAAA